MDDLTTQKNTKYGTTYAISHKKNIGDKAQQNTKASLSLLNNTQYFLNYLLNAGHSKQKISEEIFSTSNTDITPFLEGKVNLGESPFRQLLSLYCRVSLETRIN